MHDSHLPLRKWFVAIYLMCKSKQGISELEWRFNNRGNDHIFVDTLRRIVTTETLTYSELVA